MTFGEKAIEFFNNLKVPAIKLPARVEVMNPLQLEQVRNILLKFYSTYYNDDHKRIFLIGINPGRFGGGITGIPFTDPVNLENILGIKNDFEKKHELSSRFVYAVISAFQGPVHFFRHFYLTAVSPFGFISQDKNLNYYDLKIIRDSWEPVFINWMKYQMKFGTVRTIAISLGMGKNAEYLQYLNEKENLFDEIKALPHPRWIMQYRFKRKEEFIAEYIHKLKSVAE